MTRLEPGITGSHLEGLSPQPVARQALGMPEARQAVPLTNTPKGDIQPWTTSLLKPGISKAPESLLRRRLSLTATGLFQRALSKMGHCSAARRRRKERFQIFRIAKC